MSKKPQKLYVYVDETGQDAGATFFVVAAAIVYQNREELRQILAELEKQTKIGRTKWHKQRHADRVDFLRQFLGRPLTGLQLFFARYKKPVPYYFPTLETIENAVKSMPHWNTFRVAAYIDGLDRQSAKKFTNALRIQGLTIRLVKGVRDESEEFIRLADRWVGCVRMADKGEVECKELMAAAIKKNLLKEL